MSGGARTKAGGRRRQGAAGAPRGRAKCSVQLQSCCSGEVEPARAPRAAASGWSGRRARVAPHSSPNDFLKVPDVLVAPTAACAACRRHRDYQFRLAAGSAPLAGFRSRARCLEHRTIRRCCARHALRPSRSPPRRPGARHRQRRICCRPFLMNSHNTAMSELLLHQNPWLQGDGSAEGCGTGRQASGARRRPAWQSGKQRWAGASR